MTHAERPSPSALLEHAVFVRAVARATLRGDDLVDDVEQDTWIAALTGDSRPRGGLRAWLGGIARRRAADAVRRESALRRREHRATRPDRSPATADVVERLETARRVVRAVLALDEPCRTAILLRFYDDLPPRRMAEHLGVPVETARTRVKRGLSLLRARLAEDAAERREDWRAILLPLALAPVSDVAAVSVPVSGLGALLMSKSVVTVGIVAVLVLVALLIARQTILRPDADREPGAGGDAAARAAPPSEATLQGRAAQLETPPAAEEDWIVRGVVLRNLRTPAPGVPVAARWHPGFTTDSQPTIVAELTTDAKGWFRWPLRAPTEPGLLVVEAIDESGSQRATLHRALPGTPPPTSLAVYLLPQEARVTGRVIDERGDPVPEARILRSRDDPPVSCETDGTYAVAVYGGRGRASLVASAPGHAIVRQSVIIEDPRAEVQHDFVLHEELAVVGQVTDPEGRPVEGARVRTFATGRWNDARSDAAGRYRLGRLDPRRPSHNVYVTHPAFTEVRSTIQPEGDVVELDVQLQRGVRVAGTIVDAKERPLPGAEVVIGFNTSAYNRLDALATDEGRYVFPVVAPGTQTVIVQRVGFAPSLGTIEVPDDRPDHVADPIVLREGRTLTGTVTDSDGAPIAAAGINLRYRNMNLKTMARTDPAGRFELPDAPPDGVELTAFHGDYERWRTTIEQDLGTDLAIVMRRHAGIAGRVVDGQTGQPITRFVVQLVRGKPGDGEGTGAGYAVTWVDGLHVTHPDGYWSTRGERLQAGAIYGVRVEAEGYAPATDRHVVAVVDADPDDFVLRLRPGAVLTGVVVAPEGAGPVQGAIATLYNDDVPLAHPYASSPNGNITATSDARGVLRLEHVPAAAWTIAIASDDHPLTIHGPVEVGEGLCDLGTLVLDRGAVIEGYVGDDDGEPLADETVVVQGAEILQNLADRDPRLTGRTWRTTTDAEGRFQVRALPAGRLRVMRARTGPYGTWEGLFSWDVVVAAGRRTEVRLVPEGTATLSGRVTSSRELPAGIEATLRPARDDQGIPLDLPTRRVDVRDGTFTFDRLEAGRYVLQCTWPSGRVGIPGPAAARTTSVALERGATEDVEISIDRE